MSQYLPSFCERDQRKTLSISPAMLTHLQYRTIDVEMCFHQTRGLFVVALDIFVKGVNILQSVLHNLCIFYVCPVCVVLSHNRKEIWGQIKDCSKGCSC